MQLAHLARLAFALCFACIPDLGSADEQRTVMPHVKGEASLVHSLEGVVEVDISDSFHPQRRKLGLDAIYYFLVQSNGTRTVLSFPEGSPRLISGERLRITNGILSQFGTEVAVAAYERLETPNVTAGEAFNSNLGEQRLLVLLVNFEDDPNYRPFSKTQVQNEIFSLSNPNSLHSYLKEVSYNQVSLVGTITNWKTMAFRRNDCPANSTDLNTLVPAAMAAVKDVVDYETGGYNRLLILFPKPSESYTTCPYGRSTLGMVQIDTGTPAGVLRMSAIRIGTATLQSNYDPYWSNVFKHEFGHSLGLYHANDWECGDQADGLLNHDCDSFGYGDIIDVMGSGVYYGPAHYSAAHKDRAGWLSPGHVAEVRESGIFTIEPLESISTGTKTIKIPTSRGLNYYIEYRQPIGLDARVYKYLAELEPNVFEGVFIRNDLWDSNSADLNRGDTNLLDATPHFGVPAKPSSFYNATDPHLLDSLDSALRPGLKLRTVDGELEIELLSLSETSAEVRVTIHQNEPPRFLRVPALRTVYSGGVVEFSFSVSDPNSDIVGVCADTDLGAFTLHSGTDSDGSEGRCRSVPVGERPYYPVNGPGPFNFKIALPSTGATPSEQRISFLAFDGRNGRASAYLTLKMIPDTTPPKISQLLPLDNLVTSEQFIPISASITDNARLKSVELTVDGAKICEGALSLKPLELRCTTNYLPYRESPYVLDLRVTDINGNVSRVTRRFTVRKGL